MGTKIYIKDLPCYQRKGSATEKSIRVAERHFYDLKRLPTEGLQQEMESFILSRGEKLSMATVDVDIIHYNVLSRFMKEKNPSVKSFRAMPEEILVKKFKAWLLSHGYKITRKHHVKYIGADKQEEAGSIKYLRLPGQRS